MLSEIVKLPSIRRLRINWDRKLSRESARRLATALFTAHQDAKLSRDGPSQLTDISFSDNYTFACTHNYTRLLLPDWAANAEARVGERQIVELLVDEPSDWDWGSSHRAPEYYD
jgi:hypothetical protein